MKTNATPLPTVPERRLIAYALIEFQWIDRDVEESLQTLRHVAREWEAEFEVRGPFIVWTFDPEAHRDPTPARTTGLIRELLRWFGGRIRGVHGMAMGLSWGVPRTGESSDRPKWSVMELDQARRRVQTLDWGQTSDA